MREGFDLATPAGNLMLTMLAAVAELERRSRGPPSSAGLDAPRPKQGPGAVRSIDDAAVCAWRAETPPASR